MKLRLIACAAMVIARASRLGAPDGRSESMDQAPGRASLRLNYEHKF